MMDGPGGMLPGLGPYTRVAAIPISNSIFRRFIAFHAFRCDIRLLRVCNGTLFYGLMEH